jgi:hypothetical protein
LPFHRKIFLLKNVFSRNWFFPLFAELVLKMKQKIFIASAREYL